MTAARLLDSVAAAANRDFYVSYDKGSCLGLSTVATRKEQLEGCVTFRGMQGGLALQAVLRRLLADPARLRRMQDALAAHQHLFLWAASEESGGILASLERELAIRAGHLADGPLLALS